MKRVLVIMGSPRRNGNTELLADAFIEGAVSAGHDVEKLAISDFKINGCIGCNSCFSDVENRCFQRDDMEECYKCLAQADVLVFATPIYFYGVSSQLKCLIDRLHNPIRNSFAVKKLVLLAVCADNKLHVFNSVLEMYHAVLSYFSLENGGEVTAYGVAQKGDIAGNEALNKAREIGEKI